MGIQCCDEDRLTPFCPICGTVLLPKTATINGLLAHIRKGVKTAKSELERFDLVLQTSAPVTDRHPYVVEAEEKLQRTLAEWEAWESGLLELMTEHAEMEGVA